jgi:hypothetical protein
MEANVSILNSWRGAAAHSCPGFIPRSRCGLVQRVKNVFLPSTLGIWSSLAEEKFLNSWEAIVG